MRFQIPQMTAFLAVVLTAAPCALALPGDPTDRLSPTDATSNWDFGYTVDASGNRTLVGAIGVKTNNVRHGAAYVMDHTTGTQLHKLVASDSGNGNRFGHAVSIDGNLGIIGSPTDDDNGTDSGSAYVFDMTTGQELWKLLPSDGAAGDWFGEAVGISGNIAIVGAPWADHDGDKSGAAYFFDLTNGQEIGRWLRGDGAVGDEFGRSVAIDGFKAVAGAPNDDPAGTNSGSVYVYDLVLGLSQGRLSRTDGAAWDLFGWSVDLDAGKVVVGATGDEPNGTRSGSAYLFDVSTGLQLAKLVPADGAPSASFGISAAIDGNNTVIGAHFDSPGGAAYLFDVVSGTEVDKLVNPTVASADWMGWAVGISGSTAMVGAHQDDDDGSGSGSVFLFDTCPESLVLTAAPPLAQQGDTLALTTAGGVPGRPNLLYVTDVSGITLVYQVTSGVFDAGCRHYFLPVVPGGLAGLDVTFLSVGWGGPGFQLSNTVTVQFQ